MSPKEFDLASDTDIVPILRRWAEEAESSKDAAILRSAAGEIDGLRHRLRSQNCLNHPGKPAKMNGLCWACIKANQRKRGTA